MVYRFVFLLLLVAPRVHADVVFDEKVTISKAKCTTDCEARCRAKEVSACQNLPLAKHTPAELCDAGAASYCTALAGSAKDATARKSFEAKAKTANDHLIAACKANDALACAYAKPSDGKLIERACTLGLWEACGDGTPDKRLADLAARACNEQKDATICDRAANRVKDASYATALRARGAKVGNAICRAGGVAAIEGCEWEAALTTTPSVTESQLAAAARAAEAECKKGSVDACVSAGVLVGKDPGSLDSTLSGNAMRFILIKRAGDAAKSKPFYIEACKLAWKTDAMNPEGPDACAPAKAAGVDIMALQEASPSNKPAPVKLTPKKK